MNDIREVVVEEFLPVENVPAMLQVIEAIDRCSANQTTSDHAIDLKRSMVWMEKYIAPTAEFWDWTEEDFPFDSRTRIRVTFIGLGWVLGLVRQYSSADSVDIIAEEATLSQLMDTITVGIPVDGLARFSAVPWTEARRTEVVSALKSAGRKVEHRRSSQFLTVDEFSIRLSDREYVRSPSVSAALDDKLRSITKIIKDTANSHNRFQGADWVAHKRRRLTLVTRRVQTGRLAPSSEDFAVTDIDYGNYKRSNRDGWDAVRRGKGSTDVASLLFPEYSYHLGVIHPRAIFRLSRSVTHDEATTLRRYLSYLWVNHYTRTWRYLQFEDQFAYTDSLRRLPELKDADVLDYGKRILNLEEMRTGIISLNRIDDGQISAYAPPHDGFVFTPQIKGQKSGVDRLRTQLIPSSVTQLTNDPLQLAPPIVEQAVGELARLHGAYAQAASLRMQRLLQVLQCLFVVAAVVQILILLPIAELAQSALREAEGTGSFQRTTHSFRVHDLMFFGHADLTLILIRVILLGAGSAAAVALLRWGRFKSRLERWFG